MPIILPIIMRILSTVLSIPTIYIAIVFLPASCPTLATATTPVVTPTFATIPVTVPVPVPIAAWGLLAVMVSSIAHLALIPVSIFGSVFAKKRCPSAAAHVQIEARSARKSFIGIGALATIATTARSLVVVPEGAALELRLVAQCQPSTLQHEKLRPCGPFQPYLNIGQAWHAIRTHHTRAFPSSCAGITAAAIADMHHIADQQLVRAAVLGLQPRLLPDQRCRNIRAPRLFLFLQRCIARFTPSLRRRLATRRRVFRRSTQAQPMVAWQRLRGQVCLSTVPAHTAEKRRTEVANGDTVVRLRLGVQFLRPQRELVPELLVIVRTILDTRRTG